MPSSFPPRWRRRARSWVRRSAVAWWAGVALLCLVTGGTVRATLARSSAVLDEVGTLRPVVVVTDGVAAGEVVEVGDVAVARRPSSMLPDGAARGDEGAVVGRVALVPLLAGEVVVASKLAPDGLQGAAALLPSGMRALAVPAGPGGRPPVSIGDAVDVLATLAEETVVVAEAAMVLALDDASDAVTVAVSPAEAPAVASAIATGTVTLALTGRGSR